MRALLILALAIAVPASATELEDRLRDQLRQTVMQLRELQGSQATLAAAKASAEKERDALKAKGGTAAAPSAATTRALAAARSDAAAQRSRADAATTELAVANARLTEAGTRIAAMQQELNQLRTTAAAATTSAASRMRDLKICIARNTRLVATGRELVALHQRRYGHGKFPPLQLLRTRVETEAQALGDRVAADAQPVVQK